MGERVKREEQNTCCGILVECYEIIEITEFPATMALLTRSGC